jgi:hypothetical protein
MPDEKEEAPRLEDIQPVLVEFDYIWEAVYGDGSETLPEYTPEGRHWFKDIDLGRCTALVLRAMTPHGHDISVKIDHQSGQRPIFFRRYPVEHNLGTSETIRHAPIHVLGWQRTVHGTNVAHYTFIFPDGSILLSDDLNAV